MNKNILLFCILFAFLFNVNAQEILLTNAYNRNQQSLNGEWHYIVDPYENGYYNYRLEPYDKMEKPSKSAFFMNSKPEDKSELLEYDFDKSPTMKVPGDWNTQHENLFYYEGTLWYKKSFDYSKKDKDNRVFLYFGAVNYEAEVYLNGKKLGTHIGGFTPFHFEATDLLKEKDNFIVVKVDNKRKKEAVPTLNTDWWNYGGITRDVSLIETPSTFISDYVLQINPKDKNQLQGFLQLNGPEIANQEIMVSIPELKIKHNIITDSKGKSFISISSKNIHYWSDTNPKLYNVTFSTSTETLSDQIGFRTITTQGKDILLNGKKVFLKGICIHEESPLDGDRANSIEDAQQLLTWAKELGCNYVRLAHYPHNEHMIRLADKMGILVWEEIPVYWTIDWENPATYDNAQNQLSEMIQRDKNRSSVIIWSMANETPNIPARNIFLNKLAAKARNLDNTRLISAALEQSSFEGNPLIKTIDDPFAEVADVLSFNQYIGWYDGLPDKTKTITWKITQQKPVLISEFGADAKAGLHGDRLTRWSEEYQDDLYVQTLAMLGKIEQLRGFSPWILKDFRSPRRPLPGIQDGWNRKGLLSDKGVKKKAWQTLKTFYNQKTAK